MSPDIAVSNHDAARRISAVTSGKNRSILPTVWATNQSCCFLPTSFFDNKTVSLQVRNRWNFSPNSFISWLKCKFNTYQWIVQVFDLFQCSATTFQFNFKGNLPQSKRHTFAHTLQNGHNLEVLLMVKYQQRKTSFGLLNQYWWVWHLKINCRLLKLING